MVHDIKQIMVQESDTLIWRKSTSGNVTCSDAYTFLIESSGSSSWGKSIWASYIPSSCSFMLWRIFHGKLPTEEAFSSRRIYLPNCCRLCFNGRIVLSYFLRVFFCKGNMAGNFFAFYV